MVASARSRPLRDGTFRPFYRTILQRMRFKASFDIGEQVRFHDRVES
jgi:hypothetical protein